MEIKSFIGRLLDEPHDIWRDLRKQIEQDRFLKNLKDVKLTYEYYTRPKNPLDFISKRFILYPYFSCYRKKKNQDIVFQIHFQFLGDLALFLDKNRTIITCHDIYNFLQKKSFKNPLITQKYALLGLRKCRYLVAISDFTKNELISKLKIPKEKIIVIKNAVNRKMFYQIPKDKIDKIEPLYPNYKKILYVGSESERKDILTLLKSFFLIKKKYNNIKLIRVGGQSYSHYIKQLGLNKDIIYLKNISNERLNEIYNLCDLFVTPSLYEGFGFPGLEAASCGIPVICTDIPVFRELYKNFPIYFPPKNYKLLAKLILECLSDEDIRKTMSIKGIKVAGNYTWKKSADKYYNLIKYIIDNQ